MRALIRPEAGGGWVTVPDVGILDRLVDRLWRAPVEVISALATYPTYPPDPIDPRRFFMDESEYQLVPSHQKMARYSPVAIGEIVMRTGLSWGYTDKKFYRNYRDAKESGLLRMIYHVIFPAEQVQPQIDHLMRILDQAGELPEGGIWIDSERKDGQSPRTISTKTHQFISGVQSRTLHPTGCYSGDWFCGNEDIFEQQDWMTEVIFWLAEYLYPTLAREHPGPVSRPAIIPKKNVAAQQTTSHIDGWLFDANRRIDGNRVEDILAYLRMFPGGLGNGNGNGNGSNGDHEQRILTLEDDVRGLKNEVGVMRGIFNPHIFDS